MVDPQKEGKACVMLLPRYIAVLLVFLPSRTAILDPKLDSNLRIPFLRLMREVWDPRSINIEIVIPSCSPARHDVTFIISISLQLSTVVFPPSLFHRGYMVEGDS